ncbi:hypothetical protein [Aquabacterium sp. J223]|uniref:hypothetical protein n=1 Tax=Aquabacterium sp. J223 TaxID=2898431 RepID=UPI0021AE2892|nr:hypothetical protein [Aquabacterium sp. J223]UUX96669.1 hypothetical protein LRS07_05070 [Aquabacterium sp. J223]
MAACLLFAQLAVAAYACPVQATMASSADMPCAEMMAPGADMDSQQPALCAEHCQHDAAQPSADATPSAAAFMPALALLFVLAPTDHSTGVVPNWTKHQQVRERAPPQPLSVLHCCWRI